MQINLNEFLFEPGRIYADMNINFYMPLKIQPYYDLCEDIIIVEYGNSKIFLNVDWYPLNGIRRKGSFYITVTTKYFEKKLYLRKTRRMSRLRKYVLEAHEFAQSILIKMNEPGFKLKDNLLTKSQINAIKNSPPDTFINDYPPR